MPRPEKVQAVAEIKERLDEAQAVFLAEYAGLSVKEQQSLRRELRANEAEFKVVKMTLARRAAAELDIDSLDEMLLGPTGLTFANGDPVGAAKALRDFAKGHEVFLVKGGLLGREFLSPERVNQLADMEPRDVLLAKVAGAFQAPLARAAGLLAALPRNTASAIQQLIEKLEKDAPPAPSAVEESDTKPEAGDNADVADERAAGPDVDDDADTDAPEVEAAEAEVEAAEAEVEAAEAEVEAAEAEIEAPESEAPETQAPETQAPEAPADVEASADPDDTDSPDDEATPSGADEEE
jgi:large subunit ribosomal protein L10